MWLVGLAWAIRGGCTGVTSGAEMRAAARPVLIDAWLRSLPALLLILFLLYPGCSAAIFSFFACQKFDHLGESQTSYLKADFSIDCDSSEWWAMWPYAMFMVFVCFTLLVTRWAALRTRSASDFYTAGGGLTGMQNGLAIAGDMMRATMA